MIYLVYFNIEQLIQTDNVNVHQYGGYQCLTIGKQKC